MGDLTTTPDAITNPRRGFLKRAAAVVAGSVVARFGTGAAIGAAGAVASAGLANAAGRNLTPTYVPSGFRLTMRDSGRADGFRGTDETAWIFHKANNSLAYNRPLLVFQTSQPRRALSATAGRRGTTMRLSLTSGQAAQAEYHDGWWRLSDDGSGKLIWDASDVHSVTLSVDGITVGVRGSRAVGVSREELFHIVGGLARTA